MTAAPTYHGPRNTAATRAGGRVRTIPHGNPKVSSITTLVASGARPQVSPDGTQFLYDYPGGDGFFDLRLANFATGATVAELTSGRAGLPQRHSGGGVFHPAYPTPPIVVFINEAAAPHYLDSSTGLGNPGIGLFCDVWAINTTSGNVYKLTAIPIKMTAGDGLVATSSLMPRFRSNGLKLVWTSHYAEGGPGQATPAWGRYRIRWGDFSVAGSGAAAVPSLAAEATLLDSTATAGNYLVTTGGFFPSSAVQVIAGNVQGQHEYRMSLYLHDTGTGAVVRLTTDRWWHEGSAVCQQSPYRIAYMSNRTSRYELLEDRDWIPQTLEREIWVMDSNGANKERLTYYNDPEAEEYIGGYGRAHPAIMAISPDGRTILASVGAKSDAPYPLAGTSTLRIDKIALTGVL